jgi:hypothetical protein
MSKKFIFLLSLFACMGGFICFLVGVGTQNLFLIILGFVDIFLNMRNVFLSVDF